MSPTRYALCLRTTARSPRWSLGSIELPTMIAYEVPPPTCVGATNIHAATSTTAARRAEAIPVIGPVLMAANAGKPGEECSSPGGLRRALRGRDHRQLV